MKNQKITLLILLLFILAFGSIGCGDDDDDDTGDDDSVDDDDSSGDDDDDTATDDDDDTADDDDDDNDDDDTAPICDWDSYDPLIVSGKTALADLDPATALSDFNDAAVICPDIGDAQMGALLAEFQAVLQAAMTALGQYPDFPFIDWDAFQQTVETDLLPLNAGLRTAADTVVEGFPDVRLYLTSYPLFVFDETVALDLGGEWDYADAINLSGLAYALEAIEHFLLAVDLDADWTLIQTMPYIYDPVQLVHWYAGKFLEMLTDPTYPNFMTFTASGPEHFADFAVTLGFGSIDVDLGFDSIRTEIDPQEDDVTGYLDENGNGQWDEGEHYYLPHFGPLAAEMNNLVVGTLILLEDLGPALLDRGPEDLRPLLPDWFPLGDVNYILTALQAYVPGLQVPNIPIPVGRWFYYPPADGLRSVATVLAQFLYDYTTP
jgi:hypothetical protein